MCCETGAGGTEGEAALGGPRGVSPLAASARCVDDKQSSSAAADTVAARREAANENLGMLFFFFVLASRALASEVLDDRSGERVARGVRGGRARRHDRHET